MRKLWRKVVAVTLAASMMVGLTACGGSSSTSAEATTKEDGTPYKAITTTMSLETGTLDSAGNISYWWWSYTSLANAPLVELAEDGSYKYII